MKIIFFLLFTVIAGSSFALSDTLFYDNFNDNKNKWVVDETIGYKMDLAKGGYYFTNKSSDYTYSSTQQIAIDPAKDWTISSTILFKVGEFKSNAGILWGGDTYNEYNFIIDKDGNYSVTIFSNDTLTYLIEKAYNKELSYITQQGASMELSYKLMVKKINNTLKFYINNIFVGRVFYQPLFGNNVGYTVGESCKIKALDFLVTTGDAKYSKADKLSDLQINNLKFVAGSDSIIKPLGKGFLTFDLSNKGGIAQDIEVFVSQTDGENDFYYSKIYLVDSIAPDGIKTIRIPIKAGVQTIETTNTFQISISEINAKQSVDKSIVVYSIGSYEDDEESDKKVSNATRVSCVVVFSVLLWIFMNKF